MKKFILIFILFILTSTFAAFFYKVYLQQKTYHEQNSNLLPINKEVNPEDLTTPSLYLNYTKEYYDSALANNRVLVLFFTSNWCSECNNQEKINKSVIESMTTEGVVGLNIHILDSETTTESDALAKKFDVKKENTFIVLNKSGAVAFRYVGEIDGETLKSKILEVR